MGDGKSTKGHDVRNTFRLRQETIWSADASQELLRLRFHQLRDRFDSAQTVADVHEAWGVVASTLSSKSDYGLQVDAVKCSDQLSKLRQQWQESSTNQLHVMMAECFSKNIVELQQHQSLKQSIQARNKCNKVMGTTMMQNVVKTKTGEGLPKTSKKKTMARQQVVSVLLPSNPVPSAQVETFSSPKPTLVLPKSVFPTAANTLDEDWLMPVPDPIAVSSPTLQGPLSTIVSVEEEEIHRHGEIMRALEKRSQQLERLAQSHKHLADVTQQLMEALVHRNIGLT